MPIKSNVCRFRVWCQTDNKYEYAWAEIEPTACPANAGHTINTNRTSFLQKVTAIKITNADSPYKYKKHAIIADTTDGNITLTLKNADRINWPIVIVKPVSANTVTIDPFASELIDGQVTLIMTGIDARIAESNGSIWTTVEHTSYKQVLNEIEISLMANTTSGDQKGDVLVDDGEELTYLTVGNNGEFLQIDSASIEGLRWINLSALSQTLTNKQWGDNLDMNSNKIVNLADPIGNNDAANKRYVDSVASGLSVKDSVRAATVIAGTLATSFENGDIIDGVTLVTGDRILIKDQALGSENGLYLVTSSGAPTRTADCPSGWSAAGSFIFVQEGTQNADSGWVCATDAPNDVVGTDGLTFTQFSGAGQLVAGNGLAKTGNIIDVDLKANGGLAVEAGQLALDLGASAITGILAVGDGGTGATTLTTGNLLQGNGTGAVTAIKVAPAGTVVGTSDTQTLTNKTLDVSLNTVTNVDNASIKAAAGIDASKLADGSVSNTEFQYLNGVTSALQTQLSALNDHASSTANPHAITKSQIGLSEVANLKVKLDATTAPGTTDDNASGYSIGSRWINVTSDKEYVCLDATSTAAVWTETTQTNTASNIGTSGVGVFKQKTGLNFEFKKINAGSTKVTVTDDTGNNEIDLDVVEANLVIGNLSGAPTGGVVGTTDTQTLTNKTLTDSTTYLADNLDSTKKVQFELSTLTTATTRTLTIPDASTTLVGTDTTQTLTNKTLTAPIISSIANTGTLMLPTATDTLVGRATSDTLTNKTISGASNTISGLTVAQGGTGVATLATGTFLQGNGTSAVTATKAVPTGTVVGTTDTQTLTNKTLGDNLNANSNKIINLATPTSTGDAATKGYVDSAIEGLSVKASVRVATTVDGTLATSFENLDVADGVTLATNDRILIKNQATASQNGVYIVQASGAPVRAADCAGGSSADSMFVFVQEGTTNADSGWVCSTNSPNDIIGTNNLTFTQFSGAGQITAGNGLTKTGNTLDADFSQTGELGGADRVLGNTDAYALGLITNNLERIRIESDGRVSIGGTAEPGYALTIRRGANENGFFVKAGENAGDISFHVADQDDTFQIMEMEANNGNVTMGKTYAQTLTDRGVVYGLDNQHTGNAADFNSQSGNYRVAGTIIISNAGLVDGRDVSVDGTSLDNHLAATSGVHGLAGTVVGTSDTQTLTNKTISGASNTISGLTVAQGGTGVATLASGNFLQGNGTSAVTATKVVPTGTVVGTTDTQTLTNKTLNSTTNNITSTSLHSASTVINVASATAPTSGQVLTATSGTAATWQTPSGSSVFGSYFSNVSNLTLTSTTSASYVERQRLTTVSLPAGTYRLGWHYVWRYSNSSYSIHVRIGQDGTSELTAHVQEPKDVLSDNREHCSGFNYIELSSGVHYFTIDYSRGISGTSYIHESRMEFWRVA